MFKFMVMSKSPDGEWGGLGSHTFAVPPRTGEYVMVAENGIEQAYKVKAVLHPLEEASTAGDLVLEYVSTATKLRKDL
jgi:hypothetical protein